MTAEEIAQAQRDICMAFAVQPRVIGLNLALPRRVRLRLWLAGLIDSAAIWLADHGRFRAAALLWRIWLP